MNLAPILLAAATAHGEAPAPFWQDATFWALVGFVIVVGILGRAGVHRFLASALDRRGQKVADELDEARRLREEAQELLAQYQRRQREAEEEAEGIIEEARAAAKRLADESRRKLEEQIERRAKAAEEKIARAEEKAIAEVRGQAADLAVETARKIIARRMDQGAQSALAEKAIGELREKLR